jgi:hypothetical protein
MISQLIRAAITVAAVALAGASAAPVLADTSPLTLTLMVERAHDSNDLVLSSHLTGVSKDRPQSIAFFVVSEQFGQPLEVGLGSVAVDKNGDASLEYAPTWSGEQQFVARLEGMDPKDAPAANASYNVTDAAMGPLAAAANPARPFLFMGMPFLGALLGLVAIVWLTLLITLAVVIRRLPRLADRTA